MEHATGVLGGLSLWGILIPIVVVVLGETAAPVELSEGSVRAREEGALLALPLDVPDAVVAPPEGLSR